MEKNVHLRKTSISGFADDKKTGTKGKIYGERFSCSWHAWMEDGGSKGDLGMEDIVLEDAGEPSTWSVCTNHHRALQVESVNPFCLHSRAANCLGAVVLALGRCPQGSWRLFFFHSCLVSLSRSLGSPWSRFPSEKMHRQGICSGPGTHE